MTRNILFKLDLVNLVMLRHLIILRNLAKFVVIP